MVDYKKISRKYWVVLRECVVSARHLTSAVNALRSHQDSFAPFTDSLYKTMAYMSDFANEQHWLELLFINQQRKSSSFGRSSGSQKHSTVCVSVCGGSPSCQVCNILVSSLLFKALVIDYSCQTVSVTVWHAIFAQVIFVFFQLSSCLILGASVTVYGKVGMVVSS